MQWKILAILMIFSVITVSGCLSTGDSCGGSDCDDHCSGSLLLHDGKCVDGQCMYIYDECDFGCSVNACNDEPPHLKVGDSTQSKDNLTLSVDYVKVILGELGNDDDYEVTISVFNEGETSMFSISSVSLLTEAGLMHGTTGFTWSDIMKKGEERSLKFNIRDIPQSRRDQDTTLLIRTNKGHFYFPTSFEA